MKLPLLVKVLVAIMLGVLLGHVMPDFGVRLMNTFCGLFDQLLKFFIPLIIVGLVVDWLIWMIRWRPYWLWLRKRQIIYEEVETPGHKKRAPQPQQQQRPAQNAGYGGYSAPPKSAPPPQPRQQAAPPMPAFQPPQPEVTDDDMPF